MRCGLLVGLLILCGSAHAEQVQTTGGQEKNSRSVAQKFSGWRDQDPLTVQKFVRKPSRKPGQEVFEPEDQVEDLEGPGPGSTGSQGNFGE